MTSRSYRALVLGVATVLMLVLVGYSVHEDGWIALVRIIVLGALVVGTYAGIEALRKRVVKDEQQS